MKVFLQTFLFSILIIIGFFFYQTYFIKNESVEKIVIENNIKKNDIIIMPSVNFIASYSAAKFLGAKIILCDVNKITGQITPDELENCIKKNKLTKIKALITMFLGGYPNHVFDFFLSTQIHRYKNKSYLKTVNFKNLDLVNNFTAQFSNLTYPNNPRSKILFLFLILGLSIAVWRNVLAKP